ncbi:MAG TPA: TraB/GumN family protein [Rhizomicrobium sp.]|nr:TraB/GumN family protein [Rhizomicrobium sp.]
MRFRRLLTFLLLLLAFPAFADTAVHPSLWHIRGSHGEAWLLGSIHILPPDVQWRSPEIAAALDKADVFVFEVPQDEKAIARLQDLIARHGYLPDGQTLRAALHPKALPDFDAALQASGLPLAAVNRDRPWLAGLQMMFAQASQQKFSPGNGVDTVLMAEALKDHKQVRYLETIDQQFALLAPDDRTLELEEFESGLKDMRDLAAEVRPMVDAWSEGDQKKLDVLINSDLDEFPAARKMLLDDRNRNWVPKIARMLREKHRFFIVVGAGHLTGPTGVPALLRKAGYEVDGP